MLVRFDGKDEVRVSLREGTPTVAVLLGALPFKASAHRWGDEVYFKAPIHAEIEEDARAEMNVGDVAFWPDGDAVAIFFGPTPVSTDSKPRAYSPCNIVGKVTESPELLKGVKEGTPVEVLKG